MRSSHAPSLVLLCLVAAYSSQLLCLRSWERTAWRSYGSLLLVRSSRSSSRSSSKEKKSGANDAGRALVPVPWLSCAAFEEHASRYGRTRSPRNGRAAARGNTKKTGLVVVDLHQVTGYRQVLPIDVRGVLLFSRSELRLHTPNKCKSDTPPPTSALATHERSCFSRSLLPSLALSLTCHKLTSPRSQSAGCTPACQRTLRSRRTEVVIMQMLVSLLARTSKWLSMVARSSSFRFCSRC